MTVVATGLDRKVGRALVFIDAAIAHLRSFAFSNSDPRIESAIAWLEDAKSELQHILDDAVKNVIVFIDLETAKNVTRKARAKNAVEVLVDKCINEYISGDG
jgi:squalene cyclase